MTSALSIDHISRDYEPYCIQNIRSVALAAQQLVKGDAATLVVFHHSDHDDMIAAYGTHCEREDGAASFDARFESVPQSASAHVILTVQGASILDPGGVAGTPAELHYRSATSAEASLGEMPLAALPLRDATTDPARGVLIVRRAEPFEVLDLQRLRCIVPAAVAAVRALPPTVLCDRCASVVPPQKGLVAFVADEWIAGHKNCYDHDETKPWFELSNVQAQPVWYTRVATTGPAHRQQLTVGATGSWYALVEAITGQTTMPRDGAGEPIRTSAYAITDPDE